MSVFLVGFAKMPRKGVGSLAAQSFILFRLRHRLSGRLTRMKGSPCCAGLMRSCLHTYRTKTNLTQHIIQPWGGHQPSMGGSSTNYGGGPSAKYGGGSSTNYGGAISQVWGGHQPTMGGASAKYVGGGGYFPTSMYRKSKSRELL